MLFDFVLIALGISLIIWRKPFSEYTVEFQKKNFGIKFEDREVREGEIMCIVFGIISIAYGLAKVLEIVN